MLNSSFILEMLSGNFVYGHAIEISIGMISYPNISNDFLGEALLRTTVTIFKTSKYVQRCFACKITRTTDRVSRSIGLYLFKKVIIITNAFSGIKLFD